MKIKHRNRLWRDTGSQVTIAYPPLGVINAYITQFSCDEIHVDTGLIRLKIRQQVEVFFQLTDGRLCSFKAVTTHTDQHGTRLSFVPNKAVRLLETIQHPLYYAA